MKKGEIVEGIITQVDFPNKGRMVVDDAEVMVKNGLPGQKVQARLKKKRSGKWEADLLEVIEKSPDEIESPCPHFGICGGCAYLSLPYEKSIELKRQQVQRLLEKPLARQTKPWVLEGIKESPARYGYRNKMELTFGDEVKGGELSLGMHKKGSFYDIVNVPQCQIMDADYRAIVTYTREYFLKAGIPFYHKMSKEGYLRHLMVRKAMATGEILIALVTTTQMDLDLTEYVEGLKALPLEGTIAGILHTLNDTLADTIQSDETRVLYGRDFFEEKLLGLTFQVTEFSFFQTNSHSAEVLYDTAREFIGSIDVENPVIYDLYSGTGTIAQLMAPVAGKVIGVEIVEEAVEAAKENAKKNGLSNCEFIAGDVLKVIDDIEEKPDFIILDPPRDGVHPKALQKILSYDLPRLLYISCKPTSLARDLEAFLDHGYYMEKAICVDQFPWTTGVETIALLVKEEKAN